MRSYIWTAVITVTIGLIVGLAVSTIGTDVGLTQGHTPVFQASLVQLDAPPGQVAVGVVIDAGVEDPSAVEVVVDFDASALVFDACVAVEGLTTCVAEGANRVRLASTTATVWRDAVTIAEIQFRALPGEDTTALTLSIDRAYTADATPVDGVASPAAVTLDLVDLPDSLCEGKLVTIDMNLNGGNGMGTPGADVILGTPGNDVIDGMEGSDTICGAGGNDQINGGAGDFRDYLYGGPGEDTMLGNSGADRMYGGPDKDVMRGMGGQDFMWGEGGPDEMQGNFQSDNMWGGPGDDIMFGAGGKDSLFGGPGDDTLAGGENTDYLDGGEDADSVNGGRGRDRPVVPPEVRVSNGQLYDGSGCIAEVIVNCQPTS